MIIINEKSGSYSLQLSHILLNGNVDSEMEKKCFHNKQPSVDLPNRTFSHTLTIALLLFA